MVLLAKCLVLKLLLDNPYVSVYHLNAMGLIDFPSPVSWYESAKNAGLERQAANSFVSAMYSSWISFVWRSGSSKWAQYIGEGKAMQDAATAMYLTLQKLETKGFLTLTVPQDMLQANNLANFETTEMTK
jgi:hypothetical protein